MKIYRKNGDSSEHVRPNMRPEEASVFDFLESKENHEKYRREKNHFNEAAVDPKYKKGPHEWKEK